MIESLSIEHRLSGAMACKETAAVSLSSYGPDPIATTFAATDWVPGIGEPEMPAYSAAFDADVSVKRHAACDECSLSPFTHMAANH